MTHKMKNIIVPISSLDFSKGFFPFYLISLCEIESTSPVWLIRDVASTKTVVEIKKEKKEKRKKMQKLHDKNVTFIYKTDFCFSFSSNIH